MNSYDRIDTDSINDVSLGVHDVIASAIDRFFDDRNDKLIKNIVSLIILHKSNNFIVRRYNVGYINIQLDGIQGMKLTYHVRGVEGVNIYRINGTTCNLVERISFNGRRIIYKVVGRQRDVITLSRCHDTVHFNYGKSTSRSSRDHYNLEDYDYEVRIANVITQSLSSPYLDAIRCQFKKQLDKKNFIDIRNNSDSRVHVMIVVMSVIVVVLIQLLIFN